MGLILATTAEHWLNPAYQRNNVILKKALRIISSRPLFIVKSACHCHRYLIIEPVSPSWQLAKGHIELFAKD